VEPRGAVAAPSLLDHFRHHAQNVLKAATRSAASLPGAGRYSGARGSVGEQHDAEATCLGVASLTSQTSRLTRRR
jgi:hypothetical protein